MFKFLQNIFPPKVEVDTIAFLKRCLECLSPVVYGKFAEELSSGLVKYENECDLNHPSFRNYVKFTFDPTVSRKFQDLDGRFWRVRDIRVSRSGALDQSMVSIYFNQGLVWGYAFSKGRNFRPNPQTIDVTRASVEYLDEPDPLVKALIPADDQETVNWSNVYEIEIEGSTYFHLRDIGDGDMIAIDSTGNYVEIRHDPLEVTGLEGNLREIFDRS